MHSVNLYMYIKALHGLFQFHTCTLYIAPNAILACVSRYGLTLLDFHEMCFGVIVSTRMDGFAPLRQSTKPQF